MSVKKAIVIENGETKVIVNPQLGGNHPMSEKIKEEFNKTSSGHKNFFYLKEENLEDAKDHINKMVSDELSKLMNKIEDNKQLFNILRSHIKSVELQHSSSKSSIYKELKDLSLVKPKLKLLIDIQFAWIIALTIWMIAK